MGFEVYPLYVLPNFNLFFFFVNNKGLQIISHQTLQDFCLKGPIYSVTR